MQPLTQPALNAIAQARGIVYDTPAHPDPLAVVTRMSKTFPVAQQAMFDAFADPVAHVGLFAIIVGSTPPIRQGLEGMLPPNVFFAFEHVQESNLPPRLMLTRYTLDPPHKITKEAVTDPFLPALSTEASPQDKKKGAVTLSFEAVSATETKFTAESTFNAETGAVFARGFIDRVWFNFFERMMLANGQINAADFLT